MSNFRALKKYKTEIIIFIVLIVSYFFLRLFNIMALPLFTDEAIYVRWSQIARFDPSWRFISLTDGKQPSFVWAAMTIMRVVEDPLLASRFVSVFAGLASMIGLFFVGKELFRNRYVGIISSFLYLIFPMALVYDRMALYDSLVGAFMVWALYLCVLLVRNVRLDVALILGMVMGGGVLTKTNAFFSMPLLFATFLLFNFKQKNWRKNILKLSGLSLLSIAIAFGFYSVLRLSPFHHIINEKNSIFAYPLNEWVTHPLLYFVSNLRGLFDWLITYITPPFLLFIIASVLITKTINREKVGTLIKVLTPFIAVVLILNIMNHLKLLKGGYEIQTFLPYAFFYLLIATIFVAYVKKYDFWREKIVLIFWFSVPFIYLAFFGKTIYPRFIFFMVLPLLPLAALSFYRIYGFVKNKVVFGVIFIMVLSMSLYSDYFIVKDIANAPIPSSDYDQYINNWPAGGGIKEVIAYLEKESKKGKIYVASAGTFGSLPTYAIEIYLGDNKNVEKGGIYPVPSTMPEDLILRAKTMPTFVFVSNQPEFEIAVKNWPMTKILEYKKGIGKAYTRLYRVNPK